MTADTPTAPTRPGPIAIIGASGKLGTRVLERLADEDVVAVARTDASLASLSGTAGVRVRQADMDAPETLPAALDGCRSLLLISPYHPEQGARESRAIAAAEAAGVEHIVKVSSYAAGFDPSPVSAKGHQEAEAALRASGMTWTILRPDWWLDNLLTQVDKLKQGRFYFPAGDAQISALDLRDLADVAVACLTGERRPTGIVPITGPEPVTMDEVADRAGKALGQDIAFIDDVNPEWPEVYANAMRSLFAHYRERGAAPLTHLVQELTGHRARTVEDFASEVLGPVLSR